MLSFTCSGDFLSTIQPDAVRWPRTKALVETSIPANLKSVGLK